MGIRTSVGKKAGTPVLFAGSKEELAKRIKSEKLRRGEEEAFWKKVVPKGPKANKIRSEMLKRLHNLVGIKEENKERFLVCGFDGELSPQQLRFLARDVLRRAKFRTGWGT